MGALHIVLNLTQHQKIFIFRPSRALKKETKTHARPAKSGPHAPVFYLGKIRHRTVSLSKLQGNSFFLGLQKTA